MENQRAVCAEKSLSGCLFNKKEYEIYFLTGRMQRKNEQWEEWNMESAGQTDLREQPEIMELFQALEGNGLEKERQEVESLVGCLEGMESQFQQVLEELKAVRGQLAQIQDKGIKAVAVRIVEKAEGKVQEIGSQIAAVKENLLHCAKNAVAVFKERGVDALKKAVSAMKIPSALSVLKEGFHSGMESMNKNAAKMAVISGEIHGAGEHTKNIGRVLFSMGIKEPKPHNPDKGVTAKIKLAFLSCGRAFSNMERIAENAVQKLERLGSRETKKPSVKAELKRLKKEKTAIKQMPVPAQEKAGLGGQAVGR